MPRFYKILHTLSPMKFCIVAFLLTTSALHRDEEDLSLNEASGSAWPDIGDDGVDDDDIFLIRAVEKQYYDRLSESNRELA